MRISSLIVWRFFLLVTCVISSLSPTKPTIYREEFSQLTRYGISSFLTPARITSNLVVGRMSNSDVLLTINAGHVLVQADNPQNIVIWQSPVDWEVSEAFFSDLDRDGEQELSLLVWRDYRPWPVDSLLSFNSPTMNFHDEKNRSCQLILLKWVDGIFKESWAGSALASPIHDLQVLDLDGDGFQELAALEQPYDARGINSAVVVWRWNGFGFSLDTRLTGRHTDLQVLQDQENAWLVIR